LWTFDPIESGPDFGPCSDFLFNQRRGLGALAVDGAIRLIDVRNGREIGAIKTDVKPEDAEMLAFSGDGSKLFQVNANETLVWDVDNPTTAATIPFAIDLDSISFDGSTVSRYDRDHAKIEIWRIGGADTTLPVDEPGNLQFLISAGGARLLAHSMSHEWLIDVASGRAIQDGAIDEYVDPQLSDDGTRLVAFRGGKAVVMDATTGRETLSIPVEGRAYDFAASEDARFVVTPGDGALVLWSVDAKAARRLDGSSFSEDLRWGGFVFSDDDALVAATNDREMGVWETSTGKLVARLGLSAQADGGGALEQNGVVVNPSRKRAATIGAHIVGGRSYPDETAIKIWSLQSRAMTALIDRASNDMDAGPRRRASAVDRDLSHVFACKDATVAWPQVKGEADADSASDGHWRLLTIYGDFLTLRARAETLVSHCLDAESRASYGLDPAPPRWCVAERKQPYDTDDWRLWQAWRERRPETPPLPTSSEWASWRKAHATLP
jgi:hypothetical protein